MYKAFSISIYEKPQRTLWVSLHKIYVTLISNATRLIASSGTRNQQTPPERASKILKPKPDLVASSVCHVCHRDRDSVGGGSAASVTDRKEKYMFMHLFHIVSTRFGASKEIAIKLFSARTVTASSAT